MRWIEVSIDARPEDPDTRCSRRGGLFDRKRGGFSVFSRKQPSIRDYVDKTLGNQYRGVSSIKCYLSNDESGREILAHILSACGEVKIAFTEDRGWEMCANVRRLSPY